MGVGVGVGVGVGRTGAGVAGGEWLWQQGLSARGPGCRSLRILGCSSCWRAAGCALRRKSACLKRSIRRARKAAGAVPVSSAAPVQAAPSVLNVLSASAEGEDSPELAHEARDKRQRSCQ